MAAEKASERGRYAKALTRVLRSTGLLHVPEEALLVELLRDLARDLDGGAGARTKTQFLSALKDLRRVLAAAPGSTGASKVPAVDEEESEPSVVEDVDPEVADFESFRRAKGSAAPGAG